MNLWESIGKLCSCVQFKKPYLYYKSHKNLYQYYMYKSSENPYQVLQVTHAASDCAILIIVGTQSYTKG